MLADADVASMARRAVLVVEPVNTQRPVGNCSARMTAPLTSATLLDTIALA